VDQHTWDGRLFVCCLAAVHACPFARFKCRPWACPSPQQLWSPTRRCLTAVVRSLNMLNMLIARSRPGRARSKVLDEPGTEVACSGVAGGAQVQGEPGAEWVQLGLAACRAGAGQANCLQGFDQAWLRRAGAGRAGPADAHAEHTADAGRLRRQGAIVVLRVRPRRVGDSGSVS